MTTGAYIGIGSNLGEPKAQCREAVSRMRALPETRLKALSPWYSSRPVGVEDQAWFVNGVAGLETRLTPAELLEGLLRIEADMGRVRNRRWEARIIDLDLLLYGSRRIREGGLEVPHPRLHERRFVLVPLADLAPTLVPPGLGVSVRRLLDGIEVEGQELTPLEEGFA